MTRPPSFTKAQRYEVAITYGAVILCQSCGCALYVDEMEIDHHLAVIDGGAHELANWRPLCFGCNRRKGAREHRENCRAKRRRAKHGAPREPSRVWPSRPLPSRPFPKRPEVSR